MTALSHITNDPDEVTTHITVGGGGVTIHDLVVTDAAVTDLVTDLSPEERPEALRRALAVGARGLATMGLGIDIGSIDARLHESAGSLLSATERRIEGILDEAGRLLEEHLDPERKTSLVGKALTDLGRWRDEFAERFDPESADSTTADFLRRLDEVFGPTGSFEERLRTTLDPTADDSALGGLATSMEHRFGELRELIVRESGAAEGRATEAERGTAQGLDFEDAVETVVRSWAGGVGGCLVERVSRDSGRLGPGSVVGDLTVTLPEGTRIVVEAKNQAIVSLTGRDGILSELDRAMENRDASIAVCVSARSAFPSEVGAFGVYGERILVVDDGGGEFIEVALRWASAIAESSRQGRRTAIDSVRIGEKLARIRGLAETLKGLRGSLTKARRGVDAVHESLGGMRQDILDLVVEVERELAGQ